MTKVAGLDIHVTLPGLSVIALTRTSVNHNAMFRTVSALGGQGITGMTRGPEQRPAEESSSAVF